MEKQPPWNRIPTPAGSQGPTIDRRSLLNVSMATVIGGAAAAMTGPGIPTQALAQTARASSGSVTRIDAHTHFTPLRYLDAAERQEGRPFVLSEFYRQISPLYDAKERLNLLDHNEIGIHILVPLPWIEAFPKIAHDRRLAAETARLVNDEIATIVAAEPKRFRGVAALPSVDPEAMVSELHRAIKELGFVGAYVPVGPTVKRMDHPDYEALYKTIVELDATLWLHPSRPPLPDYVNERDSQFLVWQTIGWPLDTTTAMHRIVFSGVFDRHPGIRIVTHHHGGFVPYYAPRMVGGWAAFEKGGAPMPTTISKPYIDHFKKFYCDTACDEFVPKVLEMALDFFGPERVLFGSDAPFGVANGQHFTTEVLRSIESMAVPDHVRDGLLSGNAKRVLKIS